MKTLYFTVKERLDDGSWRHERFRGLESSGLAWAHVARVAASGRAWLLVCAVSEMRDDDPLYFDVHGYRITGHEAGRDDGLIAEIKTYDLLRMSRPGAIPID